DMSRSRLQRLIELGRIRINDQVVRPSQKIKPGDKITMDVPKPEPLERQGEAIPLEVLFEDEHLLVLNKPSGIVVHPAPGNWTGTLVNALLHYFQVSGGTVSSVGGKERPGLVHRLDKDTSGVMVIAKTDQAHRHLSGQFKQHTITRVYEALVWGVPKKGHGLIDLAIGRDSKEHKKLSARTASTQHNVLGSYGSTERLGDRVPGRSPIRQDRGTCASLSKDRTDPSAPCPPGFPGSSDSWRSDLRRPEGLQRGRGGSESRHAACPNAGIPSPRDGRRVRI